MALREAHKKQGIVEEIDDLPFRFDPDDAGLKSQLEIARRKAGYKPVPAGENYLQRFSLLVGSPFPKLKIPVVNHANDIDEHLARVRQMASTIRMNLEFLKSEISQQLEEHKVDERNYYQLVRENESIVGQLSDIQEWLSGKFDDGEAGKNKIVVNG